MARRSRPESPPPSCRWSAAPALMLQHSHPSHTARLAARPLLTAWCKQAWSAMAMRVEKQRKQGGGGARRRGGEADLVELLEEVELLVAEQPDDGVLWQVEPVVKVAQPQHDVVVEHAGPQRHGRRRVAARPRPARRPRVSPGQPPSGARVRRRLLLSHLRCLPDLNYCRLMARRQRRRPRPSARPPCAN